MVRDVIEATRALDGCEGIVVLRDSGSGDGFAVALWRDQAAIDAAAAKIRADIEQARTLGSTVTLSSGTLDTAITL
jgi:hypothetical protein